MFLLVWNLHLHTEKGMGLRKTIVKMNWDPEKTKKKMQTKTRKLHFLDFLLNFN